MWFLERLKKANGRPVALTIAAIVVVFVVLTGVSVSQTTTYTPTDTGLTIAYKSAFVRQNTYVLPYGDIQQVVLYEQAPPMRKVFGGNVGKTRVGTYATDELGRFQAIIDDVTRPLLYVKTADKAYMLSPEDAAGMKQLIESKMAR